MLLLMGTYAGSRSLRGNVGGGLKGDHFVRAVLILPVLTGFTFRRRRFPAGGHFRRLSGIYNRLIRSINIAESAYSHHGKLLSAIFTDISILIVARTYKKNKRNKGKAYVVGAS